jgi:hypothetical protein
VLAEKNPRLRAAGYSDPKGFWLMGAIETPLVEEAVQEALNRLRGGEHTLGHSPTLRHKPGRQRFLAGSFGWVGMLGAGRSGATGWSAGRW